MKLSNEQSVAIGFTLAVLCLLALFFFARADYYNIRDLQERVRALEQKR